MEESKRTCFAIFKIKF